MGQENQTQKTIGFNTVGRKTRPRDHIWAKTIYGIQHSYGTRKSDPKDDRIQHSWLENQTQTQRPYMGKDHIWDLTQWDRKIRPKRRYDSTQLVGKPDPETIYGQRPYMGFNTVGQENQTQKTIGFNTVGRKTRPRDHIWAKTIYGIQHSYGTRKSDPKDDRIQHSWLENQTQTQRPYMGKDHIWDSTQWDRKIRPKRRYDSTQLVGKPDPETIYGQRPYMGFNTVGQENQTQKTI